MTFDENDVGILHAIGAALLETAAVASALTKAGEVARTVLFPGEAAWDSCCEDGDSGLTGTAYVEFLGADPTVEFPNVATTTATACESTHLAARYRVVILRCVPGRSRSDPTFRPDEEAAEQVLSDGLALWSRLRSELADWERDYVVGAFTPQGPEGGCLAAQVEVAVQVFPPNV